MRIAILLPELLVQGGGDRQALCLARELQEMGHEVVVYTPTYDREKCYPEVCAGLRIVVTGVHPLARLSILPGRLRACLNMLRLARAIDGPFDVINPHHWPPHWAAVWAGRLNSKAPSVVWMCNDPPWPAPKPARGLRRLVAPLRFLSRAAFLRLDRRLVREVSRIVVLSEYAKRLIDASYDADCAVVRSGVDFEELQEVDEERAAEVRRRYGADDGAFLLLSLGILMPHRRLEDAIEGIARVVASGHDVRYVIAGSPEQHPEYAESLRRLVGELGLGESVIFAGAISEEERKLHYHACDAFVFPNESQTWALAVSEAMACGRPVVVSTGAAITETLTDHQTALFVPPRDAEAIAVAVTTLIEDEALRREIGERGRRYVFETLSWRRYASAMLDLFEEAIAESSSQEIATSAVESVKLTGRHEEALQGQRR